MTKLISICLLVLAGATTAQATQITAQGTWGVDAINWQISGDNQTQTWNLVTGATQKVLTVKAETPALVHIATNDGKTAVALNYNPGSTSLNGQVDGRAVDLAVEHTNNGTLWFKGVYKGHRPSLRVDLPTETKEGRATGFFKNEIADLYIVPMENGLAFKGYMNGYWIDLSVHQQGQTYTFEGYYMSKKVSLVVNSDSGIEDLMEYLLMDIPMPYVNFFNLNIKVSN
jgi:hypothetical protein